jgi:hypothetical protein
MSHREAVMSLYLATCALGGVSIVLTRANLNEGLTIAGLTLLVAAYFFVRFEKMYAEQLQANVANAAVSSS